MRPMSLIVAAAGLFALVGCQTGTPTAEGERPYYLSEGYRPLNAPEITPAMERFDAGIGDTATETGGGQTH